MPTSVVLPADWAVGDTADKAVCATFVGRGWNASLPEANEELGEHRSATSNAL